MKPSVFVPIDPEAFPKGVALVAVHREGELRVSVCERAHERDHRDIFPDRVREACNLLLNPNRPGPSVRFEQIDSTSLLEIGFWDNALGKIFLIYSRSAELSRHLNHPISRSDLEASDSAFNIQQKARADMRRAHLRGRPDQAARIASEHNIHGW